MDVEEHIPEIIWKGKIHHQEISEIYNEKE